MVLIGGWKGDIAGCCGSLDNLGPAMVPAVLPILWSPRVSQQLDKCVQAGTPRLFLSSLAPADLKKDAGGFDLSIALGLLLGSGQVAFDRPGSLAIVG